MRDLGDLSDHDTRVELARRLNREHPMIRYFENGGMHIAEVLWAKIDRVRVRRYLSDTNIWCRPQTINIQCLRQIIERSGAPSAQPPQPTLAAKDGES